LCCTELPDCAINPSFRLFGIVRGGVAKGATDVVEYGVPSTGRGEKLRRPSGNRKIESDFWRPLKRG
jgi:hypothetical protein